MGKQAKKAKKPGDHKRRPHEIIFLRLPPELHEAVTEHVRGLNGRRMPSEREMTLTGFVLRCIEDMCQYDPQRQQLKLARAK